LFLGESVNGATGFSRPDSTTEDDKDRIMLEIVQMYRRQQEKLNSTLQKQLQLEMVRHLPT